MLLKPSGKLQRQMQLPTRSASRVRTAIFGFRRGQSLAGREMGECPADTGIAASVALRCDFTPELLEGLTQIAAQVKAVGDLDRLGRAFGGAFSIHRRPIATNHLHAGMFLETGGERLDGALRQQVDQVMLFQVDQNGTKRLTTAE
jgi:hypothetical protein